jgi:uncharacterized repeat protein (TIGR01451 family)
MKKTFLFTLSICLSAFVLNAHTLTNSSNEDTYNKQSDLTTLSITEKYGSTMVLTTEGGTITTIDGATELTICAGDGISDAFDITLTGNSGANSAWVITDPNGNILALPSGPPFDLEGAGTGTCLVWHLSFEDGLVGAEVGLNAGDLQGDFDLSNPITVTRNGVNGGNLETAGGMTEMTICAGDGISDAFDINLSDTEGVNSAWVITDPNGNILALPPGPPFDLEGAGTGTCLVWHLSFEDGLIGAEVGLNAGDLEGCFDLSNPITVTRLTTNGLDGGILEGGPFEFCVGDGIEDYVSGITLSDNLGTNSQWVITDDQGNILGLPPMPGVVNFDEAGSGTCLIWHLSFEDGLVGAEVGLNAGDLQGCFDLSNPITVTRNGVNGGNLETASGMTEMTICVGDGISDAFEVSLSDTEGANSAWVITDPNGNILALPPGPPFDLEGAGTGTCLVWHLSFEDGLIGAEVGLNAGDLEGCFDLSNPITVTRLTTNGLDGGILEGGPFEFCVGDGIEDYVSGITLSDNLGTNSQWVITDDQGNILGLPPMPGVVNFDETGSGTCLIWHLSFEDGLVGAEVGLNAGDLEGCFDLSNPITVTRLTGNDCPTGNGVDLELDIAVDNLLYDQYENVTYTITAFNNGTENATNIVVEAGLPTGMVYTDHSESAGDYNLFFEEWTIDELASGESATLELVLFTLVENPDITNFVQILAQDQTDTDSSPGNGNGITPQEDDEAAITITPIDPKPQGGTDADLSLSISASTSTYDQYEDITYTITLTNSGPDDATGIDVAAGLPNGMVYTDHSTNTGDYNLYFEEWNIDFLASGESAVLELVLFTLIEDEDITNFVEVLASNQDDPDSTPDNGNGVSPQEDDEAAVTVSFLESFAGSIHSFENNQVQTIIEGIELYPVPTKDQLTVNLSLSQDEIIDVQIFDITGRVMSFDQISVAKGFDKFELDVSSLTDGLYFLNIRYAESKVLNEKFQKVGN